MKRNEILAKPRWQPMAMLPQLLGLPLDQLSALDSLIDFMSEQGITQLTSADARVWARLTLGVDGLAQAQKAVLALEGDFSATWLGALFAFGAPLCWSIGSYASRKLSLPGPAMASAAQWLTGGVIGLLVAVLFEPAARTWQISQTSAASWAAWGYLVVMGTLVTLNAYLWLLKNSSSALASSYSFVNPVVALWVGVALGGEVLTGQVFIALPLILLALALIVYGQPVWRWVRSVAGTGLRQA